MCHLTQTVYRSYKHTLNAGLIKILFYESREIQIMYFELEIEYQNFSSKENSLS